MAKSVVHKHPLALDRVNLVRVPWGTQFIHFDFQDRTPTVWSLKPMETSGWHEYTLKIIGTGWEFEPSVEYPIHVGTAIVDWFVWHLFILDVKRVEHGS